MGGALMILLRYLGGIIYNGGLWQEKILLVKVRKGLF